mgnify:FL=1
MSPALRNPKPTSLTSTVSNNFPYPAFAKLVSHSFVVQQVAFNLSVPIISDTALWERLLFWNVPSISYIPMDFHKYESTLLPSMSFDIHTPKCQIRNKALELFIILSLKIIYVRVTVRIHNGNNKTRIMFIWSESISSVIVQIV